MLSSIHFLILITFFGTLNSQEKVIHSVEIDHYFSSAETKDTFQIILHGSNIIDGKVTLKISSKSLGNIFEESYPANYLIGYGLFGDENTTENQENYILKRMDDFFNEDNFIDRPIAIEDSCESDYSDCEIWEILKSDSTLVGFYFLIGEEAGCWIAYSKKLKKVVRYYCCC